jgi:hypothetical protein
LRTAFSVFFFALRCLLSAISCSDFNIATRIKCLVHEFVRLDVVLPPNVPDLPTLEAREQTEGLLEEGPEQPALNLVLTVDLPDEQFAVTVDKKLFGPDLGCGSTLFVARPNARPLACNRLPAVSVNV